MTLSAFVSTEFTDVCLFVDWQKFLCGGRLMFGPDAGSLYLSSFLIGCPAFAFCIRMLVRIKEHDPLYGYGVLTTGIVLTVLVSHPGCIVKGLGV